MNKPDLFRIMKEQAEKIQTVVSEVSALDDVFTYTLDITKRQGGKTIAAPGLRTDQVKSFQARCTTQGIQLLVPPFRKNLNAIHTGLTAADWAIAETGTLVVNSALEDLRIATMLSETHVAFLPKSAIYPDLDSLADQIDAIIKDSPSYLAFISGPSRTADIERVLSIGVHGPKELHILLLEDTEQ